jgi:nitrous oxidase accessory protein NosD
MLIALLSSFAAGWLAFQSPDLPVVEVTTDNTEIAQSCLVRIAADLVIADSDHNGVLHIVATGITVAFEKGSVLRGAADGTPGDTLTGIGVRLDGVVGVTLRDMEISGFRCGVLATQADDLAVEDMYFHHNFRQHLKSTPAAEDSGDWLWPHENDEQQWRKNYGAALCVERSDRLNVKRVKVREQQNGILLDRVQMSRIEFNDCSFLSGWGLALWRSDRNLIKRNNFNFCIRGYSHGVYNRGQDSAGILMFEQCSGNVIFRNSVTHGGDGIFAFSGKEALGETPAPTANFNYVRRGNNDNTFYGNNLSYAAAHGLELTFGFDNVIIENLFVGNAICGFWGGYSQRTIVKENRFQANGDSGYGLERGAINIDHSRKNQIIGNRFESTTCAVHLWRFPSSLEETPWGKANSLPSVENLVAGNSMAPGVLAVQLRGEVEATHRGNLCPDGTDLVVEISETARWMEAELDSEEQGAGEQVVEKGWLAWKNFESTSSALGGREAIIMTEWGPWDHQAPLLRQVSKTATQHEYEMLPADTAVEFAFADPEGAAAAGLQLEVQGGRAVVVATEGGYAEYQLMVVTEQQTFSTQDWFLVAAWQVHVFPSPCDPREDEATWRAAALQPPALSFTTQQLSLIYGSGGPGDLAALKGMETKIGKEAFGTIARTSLRLKPGMWRFQTRSDDGVRVLVDGKLLFENWTWHGPTVNEGILEVVGGQPLEIVVEHFELDGYATLELQITPFH